MKTLIKKIFLFLGSIATFLAFPALTYAATLSLSPATSTINRGCSTPVQILLDTQGTNTDGTDAILFYDPTRFNVSTSSISNGTIYPDYPGNVVDSQAGKISISGLASVATPFTGQGTLATINLQVLDNAPTGATSVTFDFDASDKAKTTDSNVVERNTIADVLNQVTNGQYTIGTGKCGTTGSGLGQGAPGDSSGSATPVPTFKPPSQLPAGGILEPTVILAISGTVLVLLGIVGLALL